MNNGIEEEIRCSVCGMILPDDYVAYRVDDGKSLLFVCARCNAMPDWQQRVVKERSDLYVKACELRKTLSGLGDRCIDDPKAQKQLQRQHHLMILYIEVLDKRIQDFKGAYDREALMEERDSIDAESEKIRTRIGQRGEDAEGYLLLTQQYHALKVIRSVLTQRIALLN